MLWDFMRSYVERKRRRAAAEEARRQSRFVAARSADPTSDEADVMRWIEDVSDDTGWKA